MNNNVRNPFCIWASVFVIFLITGFQSAEGQVTDTSGLLVVRKWSLYKQQMQTDSSKKMVELKSLIPGIVYDLRYATVNNFMHRFMYPSTTNVTFLRMPAALALQKVQNELGQSGLGLKIFDAYRPYSVTVKFWELVRDERYVANPAKGSGHNRGIAVDLTLVHMENGEELNMGTGFDNFTDSAHQTFTNLPPEVLKNRSTLRQVMEKYGFKAIETEWWHFYLADGNHFEVMDIDFKTMKKGL